MSSSIQTAAVRTFRAWVRPIAATVAILALIVTGLVTLPALSASADTAPAANAPMRMQVDSSHPLLITQLNIGNDMGQDPGFISDYNSGWSIAQVWASVPDELKNNIVFVFHQGHNSTSDNNPKMSAKWLEDNVKEADELGIHSMILWDEGATLRSNPDRWTLLNNLYQRYPHFVGTVVSEQADTLPDLSQALKTANQYGGFHILGSIEETNILASNLENQSFWDSVVPYHQNFIFQPKNFHENFESVNAWTQGAWLSGVFDNWGPYFDGYQYYGCGYYGVNTGYTQCGDRWSRSMAESVASMMMIDQWQDGATVFQLENQLDIPTTGSLYDPYFYQSILPAMRFILSHHTPTRAEVQANTKVAFSEVDGAVSALADSTNDQRSGNPPRTTFYSSYDKSADLTATLSTMWYYLRGSGRYNIIPRIPKLAPASFLTTLRNQGTTVLTKTTYDPTMQYGDARDALFNNAYPAISQGDAFVQKSGSTWLVYNSHDKDDLNQAAQFPLGAGDFSSINIPTLLPHTWAAVSQDSNTSLSLTLNNYQTDRAEDLLAPSGPRDMEFNRDFIKYAYVPNPADDKLRAQTMQFTVASRPTLSIEGYDANHYTYSENWDPNQHLYTLTVTSNGVVDINLSTGDAQKGWTSVPTSSQQVSSSGSATTFTFDGSSVALKVPASATGPAKVSIDGATFTDNAPLDGGGTVFRATGLANSVHTLTIDGASLPDTSTFQYVPSVEHEARNVETDDFNYGSKATDDDVLNGSEGWRVIDGQLKLVGFVFPFYGDTTVYNTNAKLANVRYEAKMTLVNGTSGSLLIRGNENSKTGYLLRLDPSRSAEGRTGSAGYSCALFQNYPAGGSLNSTWNPVQSCDPSITLNANQQYDVVVTAQGPNITATIDGKTVINVTNATNTSAGYTGVRAPQAQSEIGGGCATGAANGLQTTAGKNCLGQFIELDDVQVTDLSNNAVVYSSGFNSWDEAKGWMTETPLVFGANTKPDPRSSFSFSYDWTTTGADKWAVVNNDDFTSGLSGYYEADANASQDFVGYGGDNSAWSKDGGYDYWAWLKVDSGNAAGLAVRATSANTMYQARLDIAANEIRFGKVVNGTWTELASTASPEELATDQWTLVKVSARGPLFTISVGGKVALNVVDTSIANGSAGLWVPQGGVANIDDARVVARPAVAATAPHAAATVVAADGVSDKHITGYDTVPVTTARTVQPTLPTTVTARYSDGSTGPVAVSWPAVTAAQLATSTNPTATGEGVGTFTINGTAAGSTLPVQLQITVMPNISNLAALQAAIPVITYDPAHPSTPTQIPGTATLTDGTKTWSKYLTVRWDTTPKTAYGSPATQTIPGTIDGWPYQKLTTTVNVVVDTIAPSAPQNVVATGAGNSVTASWTAPASDGGTPVTGYTATANPGGATCATTGALSCVISGLTNGTPYTVTVTATNKSGTSAPSTASAPVTPVVTAPDPARAVTAKAGDRTATVSWTAPAYNGGQDITAYTVQSDDGATRCATTGATSCTISGLSNGVAYRFLVVATNATGDSQPSNPSIAVTPDAAATVPDAPTGLAIAAGDGQATASWTAPASNGGSSITAYTVTASPGGATCSTAGTSCLIRGLTNGTTYTFAVAARNALGYGAASTATVKGTPSNANLALNKPVTSYYTFGGSSATNNANRVPAKMVDGDASSNDVGYFTGGASEGALLNYVAPGGDLCSWAYVDLGADYAIGSYKIMFGQNSTVSGNKMYDSPYAIQVLTDAQAAAATTLARNSSPCPARTFVAGKGTGNYNTAQYVVSSDSDIWKTISTGVGTLTLDTKSLTAPVVGRYVRVLLNEKGTAQVYGTAVNELQVFATATATVPDSPTAVSATAADSSSTIQWKARADGGSAITGYTVTASPGGATCTTTTTSCVVPGLPNDITYRFTVTAANALGASISSEPSNPVTPHAPLTAESAPAISGTPAVGLTLTASNGTWSAPDVKTGYQWTRDGAAIAGATTSSYLVTPDDVGHQLSVTVSATKPGYADGAAASDPVTGRAAHTAVDLSLSPTTVTQDAGAPTATVTATFEGATPAAGTVTISVNGTDIATGALASDGTASITLPATLPVGQDTVVARLQPPAGYEQSSSDPVTLTVRPPIVVATFSKTTLTNAFTQERGDQEIRGDLECNSQVHVTGSVRVTGNAHLTNACTIDGDLIVGGKVTADSAPVVGGSIVAAGDIVFQSTAKVGGNLTAGGSITISDGVSRSNLIATGRVGGTIADHQTVAGPVIATYAAPTVPTTTTTWVKWMNAAAKAGAAPSWMAGLQPSPGCTMATYSINTSNVSVDADTVVDARKAATGSSCSTVSLQGMTVKLSGDLTIVADGFSTLNGAHFVSADGKPHRVTIQIPGTTGGNISLSAGTAADPGIALKLITPGTVAVQNGDAFGGSVYAGAFSTSGSVNVK